MVFGVKPFTVTAWAVATFVSSSSFTRLFALVPHITLPLVAYWVVCQPRPTLVWLIAPKLDGAGKSDRSSADNQNGSFCFTHSRHCQYPVPNWDLAFALTEGREVNARVLFDRRAKDKWNVPALGGEDYEDVAKRLTSWVADLKTVFPGFDNNPRKFPGLIRA